MLCTHSQNLGRVFNVAVRPSYNDVIQLAAVGVFLPLNSNLGFLALHSQFSDTPRGQVITITPTPRDNRGNDCEVFVRLPLRLILIAYPRFVKRGYPMSLEIDAVDSYGSL